MNFIFRFLLTFSALSLFIVVFLVNYITKYHDYSLWFEIVLALALVSVPFILTFLCILLSCRLESESPRGATTFVETTNTNFLFSYLAFFFIALATPADWVTFGVVFVSTFLFTFVSRVSYYNPILLLFCYNFYELTLDSNQKVLLITRQKVKAPQSVKLERHYRRINDYTFIG